MDIHKVGVDVSDLRGCSRRELGYSCLRDCAESKLDPLSLTLHFLLVPLGVRPQRMPGTKLLGRRPIPAHSGIGDIFEANAFIVREKRFLETAGFIEMIVVTALLKVEEFWHVGDGVEGGPLGEVFDDGCEVFKGDHVGGGDGVEACRGGVEEEGVEHFCGWCEGVWRLGSVLCSVVYRIVLYCSVGGV